MSHNKNIPDISVYLDSPFAGDPPWTTARCNRLLRPITAQIRVLREIVYPQLNASATSGSASASKDEPISSDRQQEDEEAEDSGRRKDFDDPDWVPHATEKKGTKRFYSNRPSKAEARPAPRERKPGQISMPSPLIARQARSDDFHPQKPYGWQFLQTPKKHRFPLLKHDHGPDLYGESTMQHRRHVERLLQAFRVLLQATKAQEKSRTSKTGARSLMSTCLRQVPAYIEGRQQWEEEENVDKVDASEEVYQDLESMGSASGWRPLREVVRAHGVALITTATAEKLLDTTHIKELVRLCHSALAYREAEEILTAFAFTTAPQQPPKTAKDELFHFGSGIAAAHAWAERIDGWSFFYRLVRSMLISNLIPVEWAATTQFKSIWSRIIRHISDSSNPAHAEACQLIHVFLSLACGRNLQHVEGMQSDVADDCLEPSVPTGVKTALNTTVSSLSAIFAAIFLLPDNEASYGSRGKYEIRHTLEGIAADITYDILEGHLDTAIARSSSTIERLSNILTCAIITGVYTHDSVPHITFAPVAHIRALTELEEKIGQQLLNLPAIVCSVAETCGKAYMPKSQQNVFLVLMSMVETLRSYRVSSFDDGIFTESTLSSKWETIGFPSWFLKRLALDSAHEFANHSQDSLGINRREYLQFALDIEKEMENIQMPYRDTSFFHKDAEYHVGYRWEAGISEWVEATPLVRLKHSPSLAVAEPPSSPTTSKVLSTPSRPSLSQILLANSTPDVLGYNNKNNDTPAPLSKKRFSAARPPSTPMFTSTPLALKTLRDDVDYDDEEDEDTLPEDTGASSSDDDADELALTSPVKQQSSPEPPRKRARRSRSGGGRGSISAGRRTTITSLSSAFGLDGADDSEDELSFL
ncbi:uncharacterized protein LTHEOB_9892 [Lasiodiplodia theobromae]|uniref:uncharacterized protein n=1 Tax=Lasiodiplodia theobromae TaxID=45133 RepID=UPI0015C2D333|nr:uncharacterized protein LTHEOB_9892 [Lasiodiplodia theobromae]KAF4539774.1 hypothetical protein LTHEOB_9892 [Lasiodiplodia theobromae]